ncbi:MAG: EF-Tu/IF-2/RF-3 family GTPase [Patescibacteria group bacterium]
MTNRTTFQAEDVFSIVGKGTIVTGKLIEGVARKGMTTVINGKRAQILGIELFRKTFEVLTPGMSAGLLLNNIDKSDVVAGSVYEFN